MKIYAVIRDYYMKVSGVTFFYMQGYSTKDIILTL